MKCDLNMSCSESFESLDNKSESIEVAGNVSRKFCCDTIINPEMIVIIILFLDSGGRKDLLGAFKPLLIEVEPTSCANMPLEMMFLSGGLIDFNVFLHLVLANDAANDIELTFMINAFKLRLFLVSKLALL
jgi:hypothetical protein